MELNKACREWVDEYVDVGIQETWCFDPVSLVNLTYRESLTDHGREVVLRYLQCRLAGSSRMLAEMLALGVPPQANTDREFLAGHCNGNQFDGGPMAGYRGDYYRRVAEAGGQNVKGKVYLGGLAAYPGDPRAWVSGRGDVKAVLQERNWGSEGAVTVKPDGRTKEE